MMCLRTCTLQLRSLYRKHLVRKLLVPEYSTTVGSRELSSQEKLVDVTINEKTGVATVTMQRLPVNGLNLEMIQELYKTFDSLEKNNSRGMILTSASSTVFCAGLDILEMYKPNAERLKAFWTALQDLWIKLYTTEYPSAAAINGHSPAGGCLLALSCEYRVMIGPGYTIGLNETQLGIAAPRWFMEPLRNAVTSRNAELALTLGKMFPTEEALKIGLIDEIASSKEDAITKAEKFIAKFAKIPSIGRKITKLTYRQDAVNWLINNREHDLNTFLAFTNSPEVQKGLELYLESLKKKK